jgi:hypothetical protein
MATSLLLVEVSLELPWRKWHYIRKRDVGIQLLLVCSHSPSRTIPLVDNLIEERQVADVSSLCAHKESVYHVSFIIIGCCLGFNQVIQGAEKSKNRKVILEYKQEGVVGIHEL